MAKLNVGDALASAKFLQGEAYELHFIDDPWHKDDDPVSDEPLTFEDLFVVKGTPENDTWWVHRYLEANTYEGAANIAYFKEEYLGYKREVMADGTEVWHQSGEVVPHIHLMHDFGYELIAINVTQFDDEDYATSLIVDLDALDDEALIADDHHTRIFHEAQMEWLDGEASDFGSAIAEFILKDENSDVLFDIGNDKNRKAMHKLFFAMHAASEWSDEWEIDGLNLWFPINDMCKRVSIEQLLAMEEWNTVDITQSLDLACKIGDSRDRFCLTEDEAWDFGIENYPIYQADVVDFDFDELISEMQLATNEFVEGDSLSLVNAVMQVVREYKLFPWGWTEVGQPMGSPKPWVYNKPVMEKEEAS